MIPRALTALEAEVSDLPPIEPLSSQRCGRFGRMLDSAPTWPQCLECTLHHPRGTDADLHPDWVLDLAGHCAERTRVEAGHPELVFPEPVQ